MNRRAGRWIYSFGEGGDERPLAKAWLLPGGEEEIHEDPREKHGKLLIEKIEESLAAGKTSVPWKRTWDPEMSPRNIRGNLYRGGNLMMGASSRTRLLPSLRLPLFATIGSGYSSPFFLGAARLQLAASSVPLPYNQAVEHGGIVKPGEGGRHLCDARDAHREVGTPDKPVKVVLPTELSRQIEFKDEGPGISPRRMGDIFLNWLAALGANAHGASAKRRGTGDPR